MIADRTLGSVLPAPLPHDVVLRRAVEADVPVVLLLLAEDRIGAGRESTDLSPYLRAFAQIEADPGELLVVAERGHQVIGTLQVSLMPGLSRAGSLRAQIEGVRVAGPERGAGLGGAMIGWAVDHAREQGCSLVQLTSDKRREQAHRFYGRFGFESTHEGFKLTL